MPDVWGDRSSRCGVIPERGVAVFSFQEASSTRSGRDHRRSDTFETGLELLILRQAAGLPETVSVLRVCDVVVWMRHHTDHHDVGCAWV
ncbi:DUF6308 family protein [Streptomyces sp. NPDC005531]|uniref:DUF6308 family protein n=1 Tax=Streptomyces sp. NPDC005531 TaxID=3364722 RepID=UPI00367CE42B